MVKSNANMVVVETHPIQIPVTFNRRSDLCVVLVLVINHNFIANMSSENILIIDSYKLYNFSAEVF